MSIFNQIRKNKRKAKNKEHKKIVLESLDKIIIALGQVREFIKKIEV